MTIIPAAFDPVSYDALIRSIGHNRLLGQRYRDHGADWIEIEMPWDERLTADPANGALAPGPLITLMDNAAGSAIWVRRGRIAPQVTVELRVDHVRPSSRETTLITRCECHAIDGVTAYVRGIAYETAPNDIVCTVAGTFMLLDGAGR